MFFYIIAKEINRVNVPQEKIKNTYNYLLERVQQGNLTNEHGALIKAVQKHNERKQQLQNLKSAND